MEQLSIDYARALADEGMARTLDAEREEWIDAALRALGHFAALPGWREFKMEDFRAWWLERAAPPHDAHVWGAITNRAAKRGLIVWTGRYVPTISPKTHGHPVKLWRAA